MTAMAVVVGGGGSGKMPVRPPEARSTTNDACLRRFPYQPDGLWFCTLSRDAPPTIVLLGDSHANHLYGGMVRTFPGEAVLSIGACMPTLNLVYPSSAGAGGVCADARFTEQSDYLKRHVLQSAGLKRVVVSAMWRTFSDSGAEIDYASGLPVSTFGPIHEDASQDLCCRHRKPVDCPRRHTRDPSCSTHRGAVSLPTRNSGVRRRFVWRSCAWLRHTRMSRSSIPCLCSAARHGADGICCETPTTCHRKAAPWSQRRSLRDRATRTNRRRAHSLRPSTTVAR